MDDKEAKLMALSHFRDTKAAEDLLLRLGIAAETHPEMFRSFFEKVFSVEPLVARIKAAEHRLVSLASQEKHLASRCFYLQGQLDRFEKLLDRLMGSA